MHFIKCISFHNGWFCISLRLMARIVCLDYGIKRCGIAATDPMQIIVSGVDTIETSNVMTFFELYFKTESVEKLVVGLPVHKDGNFTYLKEHIDQFVDSFKKKFPEVGIDFADEQFSSVDAKKMIFDQGIKKQKRQNKALIDQVSAIIILQKYLKFI